MSNFNYNSNYASTAMLSSTENPNYKAFIDTLVKTSDTILLNGDTAMKDAGFEGMIRSFVPALKRYGKVVTVLQPVMVELRYRAASLDSREKEKALRALDGIQALAQAGIIRFKGNPIEATTGSAAIIRYVMQHIWTENVTILSQDAKLSEDCKLFSHIKSTKLEHTVQIKRISHPQTGQINNFSDTPAVQQTQTHHPQPQQTLQSVRSSVPNHNAASILSRFGV